MLRMPELASMFHKLVGGESFGKKKPPDSGSIASTVVTPIATLAEVLAAGDVAVAEIRKYSTGTATIRKFCQARDEICFAINRASLEDLEQIAGSNAFLAMLEGVNKDLPNQYSFEEKADRDFDKVDVIRRLMLHMLQHQPYEVNREFLLNEQLQSQLVKTPLFLGAYIRYIFGSQFNYIYAGEGARHVAFYTAAMKSFLALAGSCPATDFVAFCSCFKRNFPNYIPVCCEDSLREATVTLRQLTTLILPEHIEAFEFLPVVPGLGGDKIKLGLLRFDFSGDLNAMLLPINQLDRSKFETVIYGFNKTGLDYCRSTCPDLQYQYLDFNNIRDSINRIRAAKLDILIGGFPLHWWSCEAPVRVLQKRVANIQCLWSADSITSGLKTMDYWLLGNVYKGKGFEEQITERACFMDTNDYFVPRNGDELKSTHKSRGELQLRTHEVIYLCNSSIFEINPEAILIWVRILKSVESSRLVLAPFWEPDSMNRYRRRLLKAINQVCDEMGVTPGRITVSNKSGDSAMQNLINACDVFLDGYPCSGKTMTMIALSRGKPVVAMDGKTLRSSFSAGILRRLDLDEFATCNADDYVAKAVRLGLDKAYREAVAERILASQGEGGPLTLDAVTNSLELALTQLVANSREESRLSIETNAETN